MRVLLAIITILFSGYIYAAPEIRVTDLEGRSFKGDGVRFDNNSQVTLLLKGVTPTSFACNSISGISIYSGITPELPKTESRNFKVTLVNRDVLYGTISDTAKNGFAVYNNIIGEIPLNFEQISAIEMVGGEESVLSLSIFDGVKKAEREDSIFLISGDVDSGVVLSLSSENISIYGQDRAYKINDVRAIKLFSFPATPEKLSQDNSEVTLYLIDNSRLRGLIRQSGVSGMTLLQGKSSYQIPLESISFICFDNNRFIYLSDVEPLDVKEYVSLDEKSSGFLWHYQKDRGLFSQKPIIIQGREYFKGLAVHANSELTYKVDGSYRKFFATIGLTVESPGGKADDLTGSVKFIIYADGKIAYESEVFKKDSLPKDISIDIRSVKEIKLVVNDAGDGYILDRAAWALARVVR